MASRRARDREDLRKVEEVAEADSLFADALSEVPDDPHLENRIAIGKTTKNMFIWLAMLKARGFPLNPGDRLYINIGLTGTQKDRDYATIREDGQLDTISGVRDTLTSAEIDYQLPGRRTKNADPWQRFKVKTPDGKYVALNDLLTEHYEALRVPVEVLVDRDLLAATLLRQRRVPEPYREAAKKAVKRSEAAAKKAAKLKTSTNDGGSNP